MSKTIVQKIIFKNTTPKVLYDLYMNEKKHAMVTGAPASIPAKVGSNYTAHNNYIKGKTLHLVKDKLIVQTWRALGWDEEDVDSTFIIHLEPKGKNVVLHAIHANLPDKHAGHIDTGWHEHYWDRWKDYLAGKPMKEAKM
ncbi:MAG: SRPBCC domain-containing protein [Saprospiraceae bacterium]